MLNCIERQKTSAAAAHSHREPSGMAGSTSLKRHGDATRKQDGNLRLNVLHEIGRSGRFAVLEVCVERQSRASLAAANSIPLR